MEVLTWEISCVRYSNGAQLFNESGVYNGEFKDIILSRTGIVGVWIEGYNASLRSVAKLYVDK